MVGAIIPGTRMLAMTVSMHASKGAVYSIRRLTMAIGSSGYSCRRPKGVGGDAGEV